ncbi:MAG: DNA polymerase II large subunit [Candidatus Pacearchaeota archaeon]
MRIEEYFKEIEDKVKVIYSVAEEARKKGLDPKEIVEIPIATSLAGKVAGLISTIYPQLNNQTIIKRIKELEKEYGILDPAVCLKIAEEVAKEKFCKFKSFLEAIDAGIRIAFAYFTLGVVSSPIEGFTELRLGKRKDGKEYFILYYAGPVRSAGGTGAAFSLVIADYLRGIFGYEKYDANEKEIKRTITEIYDYHEKITNLQYLPTEEEIEFLAKHLPIQINGDPSEDKEVSNFKDLERIETNLIRSGFCLVFAEGLAQKAPKIYRIIKKLKEKGFKLKDWDFLEEYIKIHEKREKGISSNSPTYITDLVAGRPVLGHPSRSGAFRLRYGRARNSGYSCLAIHPATMIMLGEFIAIGTQIKIELPTKGGVVASCDTIEPPIVKLKNGSVKKVYDLEEAKILYKDVEEIIYLGDLLIPYGDFLNRNHKLMPPGYCEQEWWQELKLKAKQKEKSLDIENIYDVSLKEAIFLSKEMDIALHPSYIYYWSQIDYHLFLSLLEWLSFSKISNSKLIMPYNKEEKTKFKDGKRALELLGVLHDVSIENVVLSQKETFSFLFNLGIENLENFENEIKNIKEKIQYIKSENVLEIVNKLCSCEIKDKAGTFIGARMGRPEKAKIRKLEGSINVLFPVGEEGGRLRSINEAMNVGYVKADFPIYFCEKCNRETIYRKCEICKEECKKIYICKECGQKVHSERCPMHPNIQTLNFYERKIPIKDYFENAVKNLDLLQEEIPNLIKGVKGTSNKDHIPEPLEKGILRALFNLQVNKDGTIRIDATEMPLTHFKPKEISISIEKLKELGYTKDIYNNPLVDDEQIVELKPHDIIIPCCYESEDEPADEILMRVANFIDTLLIKFYKMKPFYNIRKREDLIGHLVACIAPHNCAGVVGRIIGFSKVQALIAHPYLHAAMRRDCDGDEASIMLLLDMLINFSKDFLPAHRGATQDAPLVLNIKIKAGEIDDMIFDFDISRELPLELYEAARKFKQPYEINLPRVKDRLGRDEFNNLWYEYEVSDINKGVICSSYKKLITMQDKVMKQMEIAEKIRAVNTSDVARLIIDRHFIRDIKGNLRKFSQQEFRCSKCNTKYRRPPLVGRCLRCKGNIIFTIAEGFIIKYLEPALQLAEKYDVPSYIKQNLDLTKSYIESIFGKEKEKQQAITRWF